MTNDAPPLIHGQDVVKTGAEAGTRLLQALRAFAMTRISAVIASEARQSRSRQRLDRRYGPPR